MDEAGLATDTVADTAQATVPEEPLQAAAPAAKAKKAKPEARGEPRARPDVFWDAAEDSTIAGARRPLC